VCGLTCSILRFSGVSWANEILCSRLQSAAAAAGWVCGATVTPGPRCSNSYTLQATVEDPIPSWEVVYGLDGRGGSYAGVARLSLI
jgi:hypothetical protein